MTLLVFIFMFLSQEVSALTHSVVALNKNYESNILIMAKGLDNDGSMLPGFCNATLINDQILITAAHCVKDSFVTNENSLKVSVGKYKYVTNSLGEQIRVGFAFYINDYMDVEFYFVPKFKNKLIKNINAFPSPREDVAVVILKKPLNLASDFNYASVISKRGFLKLVKDRTKVQMPSIVSINLIEEIATNDTKKMAYLDHINWNGKYFSSHSFSRLQEGDSGGPLLIKGESKWELFAIAKGEAHNMFSSWDVYTSVTEPLCQIAKQINNAQISDFICH